MPKTKKAKIVLVAVVFLVLLGGVSYLLSSLLIPQLPPELQNNLILFGGSLVTTLAVLAGIAQLTGFGLKDFFDNNKPTKLSEFQEQQDSVILSAKEKGQIRWKGDVFQNGSAKIILNSGEDNLLETPRGENTDKLK